MTDSIFSTWFQTAPTDDEISEADNPSNVPTAGSNPTGGAAPTGVWEMAGDLAFGWLNRSGTLDPVKAAGTGAINAVKNATSAVTDTVSTFFSDLKKAFLWGVFFLIVGAILFYFLRAKASRLGAQ